MSAGIGKSLRASLWLLPKQLREVGRASWVFIGGGVLLSVVASIVLLSLVIQIEESLEERGFASPTNMGVMPAARLARSFSLWSQERQGKREAGALEGVRIWLDCAKASEEQCQQGVTMLEGVGAERVEKDADAQLDVRWRGEGWEVGSRAEQKYVLPAAVVLHSQARRESWRYVFRPVFVPVQEEAESVEEHAAGFLSFAALQIIVMGLLLPSVIASSAASGVVLSAMTDGIEDGKYEPMAATILPPWVLFLSKSMSAGMLAGGVVLGLSGLTSLMVGPIPLVVALAFSASMGLIVMSACLWGFLMIPLQIFLGRFGGTRLFRALPNPAMAVPALFVWGLLGSSLLMSPDKDRILPLVGWGSGEAFYMVSGSLIYTAFSLAVLLLVHHSAWGRRRLSLRAGKV